MIAAAFAAIEEIFTPPFRSVLWKSLALTVLLLGLLWSLLEKLAVTYVHLPWPWLATLVHVLAGLGLVVAIAFLVTPVSFVVAGFFFDELAGHVEADVGGAQNTGRAVAWGPAMWLGVKFGLVSLGVNVLALALLVVPGVNAIAFFGANAYLFGRGFFELAALRYLSIDEVRVLRKRHMLRLFLAGCLPAALATVPIANLLTPLFATALLVRIAQPLVRPALPQAA